MLKWRTTLVVGACTVAYTFSFVAVLFLMPLPDAHPMHPVVGSCYHLGGVVVLGPVLERDPADARGVEFVVGGVDDVGAAQPLVSRLLPLGDEGGVGHLVLDAVVVQLSRDTVVGVKHVVNVPRPLVVDLQHWPHALRLALARVRLFHSVLQLVLERLDDGSDDVIVIRSLLFIAVCRSAGHRIVG